MHYADLKALERRTSEKTIVQLTDDQKLGQVNTQVVDEALDAAADTIDRHLRPRYQLPMAAVPPGIEDIASWLALYNLYSRRLDLSTPPGVQKRYDQAIAELEKLASGKTSLASIVVQQHLSGPILSNASLQTREFPRARLKFYR